MSFKENDRVVWFQRNYTNPKRPTQRVPATYLGMVNKYARIKIEETGSIRCVHPDNLKRVDDVGN